MKIAFTDGILLRRRVLPDRDGPILGSRDSTSGQC